MPALLSFGFRNHEPYNNANAQSYSAARMLSIIYNAQVNNQSRTLNVQLKMDKPLAQYKFQLGRLYYVDLPDIKSEKKIIVMKSNKELYESFIRDLKYYSLSINEDVIYNSSIDKSKECPVKFENNYFVLFGKKYSYNGLKIKKININK